MAGEKNGNGNGWKTFLLTVLAAVVLSILPGLIGYGKLSQKVDSHLGQDYQSEAALQAFGKLNTHNAKLETLIKALEKEVNRLAKIDNG